jgi:hypothetical protein
VQGIQGSLHDILERKRKVENVGVLYTHYGKFGDILGKLFDLYELGFYNSTILLCGTLAERICYDYIDSMETSINDKLLNTETKKPLYRLNFRDLVDFLMELNYIDKKTYDLLHQIYNIRNQYVHLTEGGDTE